MAAEEWTCPRCGLVGDHHKTPDPKRCKECCAVDAALETLKALRDLRQQVQDRLLPAASKSVGARLWAVELIEMQGVFQAVDAAIAKAEGRE